jgi:hypothetical protein
LKEEGSDDGQYATPASVGAAVILAYDLGAAVGRVIDGIVTDLGGP